jgi:hypothetical protein
MDGGRIQSQEREISPLGKSKFLFFKPVRGGPIALGFDYFYGTSACCTSDPPYCFIENDRTVVVPTRTSREEWRGLPGFVSGPMADDWSETDCDFTLTLIKYRAEGRSRPLPFEERVNGVR